MKVQVEMALRNVRQHLHSLELDPEVVPILPASRHLFAVASCTALHTLRCAPGWGVGLRCRAHVSHSRSVWQPECGLLRRCTDGQASRVRSIGISGQTRRLSCIGGGLLQIPSCCCNIAGPHASAKVGFAPRNGAFRILPQSALAGASYQGSATTTCALAVATSAAGAHIAVNS